MFISTLLNLQTPTERIPYSGSIYSHYMKWDDELNLTKDQELALNNAVSWWNMIRKYYSKTMNRFINIPRKFQHFTILGSAGSGKTSICSKIIESLPNLIPNRVLYMAPTGKAVSVLRKKGIQASTIHSAILSPHRIVNTTKFKSKYHSDILGEIVSNPKYQKYIGTSNTSPFFDIVNLQGQYPMLVYIQ